MNINRGFEMMIPKKKKTEPPSLFDHQLKFKLFGNVISLSFNVSKGEN